MKSFTDNAGRSWSIEVNVAALKRVRGLVNVDLLEALEGRLVERFIRDPVLLCDVLYALCKPEADQRAPPVSDEEFGRAMAGDAVEHATGALLEEIVSFCPSPRDRAALGRVLAATRTAMEKARDLVEARLESGELEKAIDAALQEALRPGASSGAAPASSGSTRPP